MLDGPFEKRTRSYLSVNHPQHWAQSTVQILIGADYTKTVRSNQGGQMLICRTVTDQYIDKTHDRHPRMTDKSYKTDKEKTNTCLNILFNLKQV